jgi:hypothetical protein
MKCPSPTRRDRWPPSFEGHPSDLSLSDVLLQVPTPYLLPAKISKRALEAYRVEFVIAAGELGILY